MEERIGRCRQDSTHSKSRDPKTEMKRDEERKGRELKCCGQSLHTRANQCMDLFLTSWFTDVLCTQCTFPVRHLNHLFPAPPPTPHAPSTNTHTHPHLHAHFLTYGISLSVCLSMSLSLDFCLSVSLSHLQRKQHIVHMIVGWFSRLTVVANIRC